MDSYIDVPHAFVAIDFETADPKRDSACAVGLVRVEGDRIVARASSLCRPPRDRIDPRCQAVHGIRWQDVSGKPRFPAVWKELSPILDGVQLLVAHNVSFDRSVLVTCCEENDLVVPDCDWLCTLQLARQKWPKPLGNSLAEVCQRLSIPHTKRHHALSDAEACARVLLALSGRSVPEPPPVGPPVPLFVPVGEAGEILSQIPVEHRTETVIRLMVDAQSLGPLHAADLVKLVRERFGNPSSKVEIPE